jgi:AAA15 family ATPase/GTPase
MDKDTGKPYDLIVLVGENGCGKSSILQAVAATLGTATQQIPSPDALDWVGFNFSGIDANHQGKSEITLDVAFSEDELLATQEYYDIYRSGDTLLNDKFWGQSTKLDIEIVRPKLRQHLSLKLKFLYDEILGNRYAVKSDSDISLNEFLGRKFALNLIYEKRKLSANILNRVGDIFWYPENRTFYSIVLNTLDVELSLEDTIRRIITNWFADEGRPRIQKFRDIYQKFFKGKTLSRIGSISPTINPPIYFEDLSTNYLYELSELSGGERAILPIILDFVRLEINNSVILIDELDLHLHPPLQQALLSNLDTLGKNNQFIITTHSDYVASLVGAMPSAKLIRVDDE